MLDTVASSRQLCTCVSVAGCLGYDVLVSELFNIHRKARVSVAGCLGYDVLETTKHLR